MRDTSLDDFARGAESEDADTEDAESERAAAASPTDDDPTPEAADEPDGEGVEGAVPTFDWTPEGATCETCGDETDRRWHEDGGLVCASCKRW
ncbi:DUF7573 domain-containing protein [Natronomonas marina]|jgi:hypothetical protein|uniref:DUF7573 domain-containing protein n=1 Tax=Natronomonas marina TaxID=2961939 RepID=UPI0020C97034|nr:hypothetical protein [Natronomonas marina]